VVLPVADIGLQVSVRPDVERAEAPDEPVLVLFAKVLTSDQDQVVFAQEPAQLGPLTVVTWPRDVKVHQLDAEHVRDRH
jgi:hypothetical protein